MACWCNVPAGEVSKRRRDGVRGQHSSVSESVASMPIQTDRIRATHDDSEERVGVLPASCLEEAVHLVSLGGRTEEGCNCWCKPHFRRGAEKHESEA